MAEVTEQVVQELLHHLIVIHQHILFLILDVQEKIIQEEGVVVDLIHLQH